MISLLENNSEMNSRIFGIIAVTVNEIEKLVNFNIFYKLLIIKYPVTNKNNNTNFIFCKYFEFSFKESLQNKFRTFKQYV